MTTDMIRKQFYINREQQKKLHALAKQRGTSEAEVIRQYIDNDLSVPVISIPRDSRYALEEILKYASKPRGLEGEPYRFNRAEIYQERENRWIRDGKKDD
ncbi:MAG: CopG family transcriptional regulator [Anaerolineaceae bacterium]|nr:DNA-binding protein [Anaerolineaceae bacterium]